MTHSSAIDAAISLAESEGNKVLDVTTGWTKMQEVIFMESPMSDFLRFRLTADLRLRYWNTGATPHNKSAEGFIDDTGKVSLSFPREV